MKISEKDKSYLLLHMAVILFGFTAILGNLIQLSAIMIVWWRVLITCISLFWFVGFGKKIIALNPRKRIIFLGIGILVGLHWLCFYGAVKLSNASITLICMANTSLFTSLIEPFVLSRKHSKFDILIGLLVVPCMYLVVTGVKEANYLGVCVGILAALFASIFTILNKKHIEDEDVITVTFIELFGVLFLVSFLLPFFVLDQNHHFNPPHISDWVYILILALICTTLAWVISLKALKRLSAFEANLVVNLEPVYGIGLAAIILKEYEELTLSFYVGAIVILLIIIVYPKIRRNWIS